MEILLLGGTGAMGRNVVDLLANSENMHIYITTRSDKKSKDNIHYIKCNAMNDVEFFPVLEQRQWDAIVDFMVYRTSRFIERIDNLLTSTRQYFFLSSSRVYSNTAIITEETPRLLDAINDDEYLKTDEYALSKAREENALIKSKYKNWTIIRPYITYDTYRLQLGVYELENWLYRVIHNRTVVIDSNIINNYTTMTYGFDVGSRMIALFGKKDALGQIYHITTAENYKWIDIWNIYADVLKKYGYKPKLIEKENFTDTYQAKYDRYYNRIFDNSKIKSITNMNDYVLLKDGIEKCLVEFLKNPQFKYLDINTQVKMDKAAKERTKLFEMNSLKRKIKYLILRYTFYNYKKYL